MLVHVAKYNKYNPKTSKTPDDIEDATNKSNNGRFSDPFDVMAKAFITVKPMVNKAMHTNTILDITRPIWQI